ncbi:MAG TPA: hypothetical protein VE978_21015 [Chitinophagales bacterium]|nr:hypothetical protein [Chitinophagales bacterium]
MKPRVFLDANYSALDSKLQCIVTMDAGDFYFSSIPVYSPQQFLAHFLAGDF